MKAIVLFSGGLDSLLAASLLKEQEVEVVGLNIITPFHDCSAQAAEAAEELEIKLVVRRFGEEYMDLLTNPHWGIGKAINPCIDCRIQMLHVAKEVMEEEGADFVATGEVAGQRPNSQKMHQLNLITRESGLSGKLLRPLCAKVMLPTEMEEAGTICRDRLRSFTGRCRVNLISMARKKYHIAHIPQPSTGCLLCEKSFAPRIRDLLRFKRKPTCWDAATLVAGRQIRMEPMAKAVVGRRLTDCQLLETLFSREDRSPSALLLPANFQGAAVLLISPAAPSFDYRGDDFLIPQESPVFPTGSIDRHERTDAENFRDFLAMAGSLVLHFTRPDKYAVPPDGPKVRLLFGQEERIMPVFPSDIVNDFTMIEEVIAAK